jgi:hypothetical protein
MNPIKILKIVFINFLLSLILISRPTDSKPWDVGLEKKSNASGHVPISEIIIPEFASNTETKNASLTNQIYLPLVGFEVLKAVL